MKRLVWSGLLSVAVVSCGLAAGPAAAAPAPALRPLSGALVVQQVRLLDPAATTTAWFGYSVALSGDTAIVGAPLATVAGQSDAGVVYVYTRSGSVWSPPVALSDPQATADDLFGYSVALSGDTALVGAVESSDIGAAYVYTRSAAGWSPPTTLADPVGASDDQFGDSVAVYGDTALVGAPSTSVSGSHAGAAYVYTRSGSTWSQPSDLFDPGASAESGFGNAVALSADTALVGSSSENHLAGAAYLYTRSGSTWSKPTTLTDPAATAEDTFGESVALSGDTALIGAPDSNRDGSPGAVYLYTRSAGAWSKPTRLSDPGALNTDVFGCRVALSGGNALVGAWNTPVTRHAGAGAAYLFTGSGAHWSAPVRVVDGGAPADGSFGYAVALSGTTALIGAIDKNSDAGVGAACVERLLSPSLTLRASALNVKLGKSVVLRGAVKDFVASSKTVIICRRVAGKLTVLKKVTVTGSGAFRWTMKARKIGKWVLVACYRPAGGSFTSKPVTLTVHR